MKQLIEDIAKALVDLPDQVTVSEVQGEQVTVLELKVAPSDLGKVIGKQGRTARSIRTLLGAAGMVISDNRRPHELRRFSRVQTGACATYLDFFIERYREAFDAEIGAFVKAVETNQPAIVGFDDGQRALALAEAALKSIAEGRAVNVSELD